MYEPQQRASNLRAIALASGVALAVVLPLAVATAGPDAPRAAGGRDGRPAASAASPEPEPGREPEPERGPGSGPSPLPLPPGPLSDGGLPQVTAVCGPQAVSPEGVRAQTCVLARDGATWGRVYYRNTTGEPLHGALSLLGPGGRTVSTPCELPAADRPGVCDTPRRRTERTFSGDEPYTAVAEVAAPDGEGLLLRSGSGTGEAGDGGDGDVPGVPGS